MKKLHAHRRSISTLMITLMAFWQAGQTLQAATFYWDTDTSTAGNNADGTGLGGTGAWDTSTTNWWDTTNLVLWPNTNVDEAIFSGPFSILPALNTVTLVSGITANQLRFLRSGYTLTGGDLTLAGTTPTLHANLGESAAMGSQILGSAGLTKTGGGSIRLSNNTNAYTGITTISNGTMIITGQGGLGASSSPIVVAAFNPYVGANFLGVNNLRGFGSGSLVLDGTGGNITISRDLSLQGRGPIGDNGAALVSTGVNTLSGTVDMGVAFSSTNLNTRIIAADGTLNITGPLNVLGVAATTISSLGGINQAGASFYDVSGVLAGSGTLEGSGGGTLFLNPSDSSGFSGTIRVSGSAASGQSVVRIDSAGVLGTRTSGTTGAVLDMNGGVLAVLMDTPDVKVSNGTNANVYFRASSTIFADHTPGSSVKDQTVAFGNMSFEDNITLTFNSRNGYGMSFTTAPVNGGDNNTTITNNLQGGALLSFTGNFWSNSNNTGNRTLTIGGAGNTTINGGIIASAAAFNHNLTKTGGGTLTLTGTTSTLDGTISVYGGTLAISDFRAITNNTSTINVGANGTGLAAGTLAIIGNNMTLANLTTSKVINLGGTTNGATILANQTGTSPGVVLNADFTATGAGTKTLTLGGANIGANTINGAIVQNGTTNVTKIDAGRWILAGENTYTGTTTISNGTLQLQANAAASTILADTSGINFAATNNYAGGTLEFIGLASTNNVETLGAITYAAGGAATIKLTPGSGGTASLIFPNISTGAGGTINFVGGDFTNNTFTLTQINAAAGSDGIITRSIYWNGADFAYRQGGVLRAPVYGVDAGTVTSSIALAAGHNEITGSFATNSISISTLKINGGHTLTLNGGQTLTLSGLGLLATGGSATITGGNSLTVGGTNTLVVRVDGGADSLRIETPLTGFTGGLTKSGAGTLVLAGANTQTGAINIVEGTVRLSGGTLGGAAALTIRQDGILELNGVTPNNINAFNNNGIVRNTSATTDVTFTVGGSNGTGTSFGIIEDGGAGKISVVKLGTGAQSWLGLSTYTGITTIGSTGIVSINNLQNGGMASGIGASSNAAGNLIFNGTSATQAYGGLSYTGTTNDETDRLFTFDGGANGGVRIQSNGVNHATSTWTNTGALAFGANATGNAQGLVLGGASTGDNRFFPIINDNGGAVTSVYKADAGIWYLMANNGYTGATTIRGGALYANDGTSLPTASNLVLDGGSLATTGAFSRTIGTGSSQMQWTAHGAGGFSAGGSPLTVNFGSGNVWGSTTGFLGTGALLLNNSGVAKSDVDIISGFEITQGIASTGVLAATTTAGSATVTLTSGTTVGLAIGQEITGNANIPAGRTIATITGPTTFTLNSGTGVLAATSAATDVLAGGYRQINVADFTSIGADFATLSGVITGAGNLAKEGTGILNLRGANTYTGQTLLRAGTLVVETLGLSTSPGATSIGDSTLGNTAAGALLLGNGGTTAGILEYVGLGETSDRYIRLNTTTGNTQIHADGTGPLILTNVANDMVAGAKTLFLRGVNAGGNMITSQLSNNGGNLAVAVDGSATWILTNGANDYSGTISVNGGALGIGHDNALGDGIGTLSISNGTVFAYGGDRTISNPVTQSATSGTIAAFIGDYSLTLTGLWSDPSSTSTTRAIRNNIVSGKTLTLAGEYRATAGTTSRFITFDGSGDTILSGPFTVVSNLDFGLAYAGTGSLTLSNAGNSYTGRTTITSGTLKLGANEVIPNSAVNPANNVVIIDPGLGLTATLDLNGKNETINGLTMNTAGTAIIDNTSGTAASLTFGANDQAVNIGGLGNYTITDSGAGALSITKTGTGIASILTGVTLTYQGSTNVNGGSMTVASAVNGTTGLSVTNASTLALTGGITSPGAITSVEVGGGSTLSLLDGAGSQFSNLTSLNLGNTGAGAVTLNLNVGDVTLGDGLNTDTLNLLTGNAPNFGNTIVFNMNDAGLNANQTYTLLSVADGGLSAFGLGNFIQGATPGGFDGFTWDVQDTYVKLITGNLIVGDLYWRGLTDMTWNGNVNNWSQDKAGTTPALSIPGQGTAVYFQWDAPTNAAVTTTLEQNFKVNSLTFEASTTPANTPTSVTIDPGTITTNRIEVAPTSAANGIRITAGGPAAVTISGGVKLGANQTWEVADATSTLSLGSLFGEADVTKTGLGKVTLTAASDATFNTGDTAAVTINAGTLEMTNVAALGDPVNGNFATVTVNGGGAFFYNGAASSATNLAMPLTLAGGTLSAGGGNQIYSGTVNVSADSFINMRNNNGGIAELQERNITLSGVVSGSGNLTVDSDVTLSAGNALSGNLTLNNAANTWTGDLFVNQGTVTFGALASPGITTNDITFSNLGKVAFQGVNGATLTRAGTLTYAAGSIGEFNVDNTSGTLGANYLVNQNGAVTLGSGGTGASVRLFLADVASAIDIGGSVTLGGNTSISVAGGDADSFATISGIIGDGGSGYGLVFNDDAGGWGQTNTIIRLTGANTFTGNITLASGTLQYDTVTNISGGASALGNGTAINFTASSTLSFIGSSAQSTDRPITSSAGVISLSANGATAADTITYNGAITVGPTADGSQIILSGAAGRAGIITGGITQTLDTADMTVNGGTWTHQTGTSRIGDALTVTGADTIFNLNSGLFQVRNDIFVISGANLNLNATGALSFSVATLSADASLRAYTGGTITLGANDAIVVTDFDGLRIGVDGTGTGTLNMGTFNQTVTEFILGNRNIDRTGIVNGSGTLTVTGNLDLYAGTIHANLASSGSTVFEKIGADTVTLMGNNSGLASTGATIVYDGILALNYTVDNNTKLRAASALDLRGARVNVIGNNGAATMQSVGGLTLASGGSSTIQVTGGTGQDAVLNLGAITRGNLAQDGTIRFILPSGTQSATNGITTTSPNSTFGMLGTGATVTSDAAYATVEDGAGTWFATKDTAGVGLGNIVALASTAKNDVTTWLPGDHITDETTGFTGTLQNAFINSLRFNAAGGSDVAMSNTGVLIIGSGGFLITSNVGGTPSMINGTLASGATELVITQDSTQTFEIGSDIRINTGVTKTGAGTLRLTGNNVYTGVTEIQEGVLQVTGTSIGDTSVVTLSASRPTTLELLGNETIGRLQGGQRATDGEYGTVAVGSNTLTINNSGANTTYAGFFTGDGTIIKQGTHNLNANNLSSGFTGVLTVESGMFQLSNIGQINASIIRINKGGALIFDNNGTTRSGTRVLDTTTITLNSADGTFQGQTIVRGLAIRSDQDGTLDETVGTINFNTGASYIGMGTGGTNDDSDIIASELARFNNATFSVRGTALGTTAARSNNFRVVVASETALAATLIGGNGAAGSDNINILPWAIGEAFAGDLADVNMGNSLVTYVNGVGFRPLDFTTEYATFGTQANATDNIRESLVADLTTLSGTTLNALVIDNNNTATVNVTGSGAGQVLTSTSGAFLFTLSNGVNSTAYSTILGGFDDGIETPSGEYVFHVVNPSSAATTPTLTATISSSLDSAADITKSGRGTLIFTAVNTAGGGTNKTTINEGILEIADLDNIGGNTGSLVFAGGTLRLGAGLTDDISLRTISLLDGGGTIDTNGIDLALANSVGSGLGGLTKVGLGNLTLNAAATYTGATTITNGTLTIGASNATGNGGALNIGAGATLALGANSITTSLVSTSGASPAITGVGTINASTGFFFSNTGDITVDAILAGSGGLFKNQTNVLTLTGLSTYTGTTEIQSGTLSINSISNVNGGASALGNAANAENGIIRMGLTTTATTLQYTGAGHTSDRLIGMQGTTGGVTIDADGTGALGLGGARFEMAGNKTLTLRGSSDSLIENTLGEIREIGGVLALTKADANTWVLTAANNHTGATTISTGVLRLGNANAVQSSAVTVTAANGLTFATGIGTFNAASIAGAGALTLTDTASAAVTLVSGSNNTSTTYSGLISGTGGLTKVGNGTLSLSNGSNSFSGGLTIKAGTVAGTNGSDAFGTGTITLGDTASNSANVTLTGFISTANVDNAIVLESGTTGTITVATTNGTTPFTYSGGVTGSNNLTVAANGAQSLTFAGFVNHGGTLTNAGTGAGTTTLSGGVGSNVTGITQNSATSTFVLSGPNSYSGATTVNAGTLSITGALNSPGLMTGLTVNAGATLNLINGTGVSLSSLTSLSLGAGTGIATLGLELGSLSDLLAVTGAATTANTVLFNLTGITGFGAGTYDLITATSGLSGATYSFGSAPGGFTYSFNTSDTLVQLVATAISGDIYWRGALDSSWTTFSAGNTNWTTDLAGAVNANATPGAGSTVIFGSTAATGPVISTTLDGNFTVNDLKFTANPSGVTAVTIASGTPATSSLTIAPSLSTVGIDVADNAGVVTISAPVIVGSDQTWNIVGTGANGSSLTVSGGLTGTGDITKTGAGALTISAVNSIYDGDFIWNGGSLTLTPTGTGGNNFVLNGVISGSGTGPLLKNGAGILVLNGANTYTGGTTLNGGTTILGNKQAFGSGTVTTSTSTPTLQASVDLSGVNAVANNFILDSNLTVSGTNSLEIAGTTTTNTASRTLTNNLTGPAALTLTGNVFLGDVGGARNLTVDGTGSTVINGVVGNGPVAGGWLVKSGTGTLTLGAANTYTGFTIINQGTLTLATGVNQTMTNTFYFGSSSSATTAGTLDLSNASATFTATTAFVNQINSTTNTPAILIGNGQSLNLNGNVVIGNAATASTTTLMTASGLGSMIVTNAASGASFRVGGYAGGTGGQGNRADADLSGLAVLTISLNTTNGIVAVNSNTTANTADKYSTLTLAATTNITAKTLSVGDGGAYGGSAGQINALKLGSVVTNINVDTFNVGTGMRDFGSVTFNAGTGSLVVRNAAGTGRAAFNMGTTGGGTGVGSLTNQNTFDVTGHSADLLFGAVAIGTQATRGDTLTNVFSFDTGTLDMTSLTMSVKTGTPLAGTHIVNSTVNLGGGTVIIGTIAQMGQTSTSDNTANATLNITGGSVTIGTGSGTAITMASAGTGTTANGAINITGGSTTVTGDIARTGGAGTTSATVTIDGGSLNMSGKNIGTGASAITFNARSGTLSNLAELNGGGTLTKTTAGVLVMEGTNSYTGATTVSDGTLQVGGVTSGSLTGTSGVTVGTGAKLSGSGSVSGSTVIGDGAFLAPGVGATDGSNQTLTFTAAGTAVEVQNGGQIQLGLTGSTQIDAGFDWTLGDALTYLDAKGGTSSTEYMTIWSLSGDYDSVKLTNGTFNLGSTVDGTVKVFDNSPAYTIGSIFKLLDWSTVGTLDSLLVGSGSFTLADLDLNGVTLGSGLAWDTSAFTTYGVIVVVPEPGRALLLLLGFLGLMLRRRRS